MSSDSNSSLAVRIALLQEAAKNMQLQLRSVLFEKDLLARNIRFQVDTNRLNAEGRTALVATMEYEGNIDEVIDRLSASYPLEIIESGVNAENSDAVSAIRVEAMLSPLALPAGWEQYPELPATFELTIRLVEPLETIPFPSVDPTDSSTEFGEIQHVDPSTSDPSTSEPLTIEQSHVEGSRRESEIRELIFVIHGIRDRARWQSRVKRLLEEIDGVKVIPIRYGYFDLLRFWFPFWTRRGPIERTRVEIQIGRNTYRAERYSIIAHSFGTYAVSQVISDTRDLVLHRLVLCGSILDRAYPWELIKGRITDRIVNDYGTRDIWPLMARKLSWGYGDTGRYGFGGALVQDRSHNLRHSDFFDEAFVETYWKPLFESSAFIESHWEELAPAEPWWFEFLFFLPWKTIIVGVLLAGVLWWFGGLQWSIS